MRRRRPTLDERGAPCYSKRTISLNHAMRPHRRTGPDPADRRGATPSAEPCASSPPTNARIFLLWLWITNLALLFGAEFDAEIERGRQLQARISTEQDIQLPVRDTTVIDKRHRKEAEDIEDGRRLRELAIAAPTESARGR